MRNLKAFILGLLVCMCVGPFAAQSSADATTLVFDVAAGGSPIGLHLGTFEGGPPYATVTLSTDTASAGCSAGCILVQATAGTGFDFFSQNGTGGIFGFDEAAGYANNALTILNCSNISTTCGALTKGSYAFDGLGNYQFGIAGTGTTVLYNGNPLGVALQTFSFDILDNTQAFTSVSDLEGPSSGGAFSGLSNFASDICEPSVTTVCAETTSGSTDTSLIHAYIGVTPEPGTYLLFGSGLLILGAKLRKKRAHAV